MKKQEVAADIFQRYGALVSVSDIARYTKLSRSKVRRDFTDKLTPTPGSAGRKRYFYKDVAAVMAGGCV